MKQIGFDCEMSRGLIIVAAAATAAAAAVVVAHAHPV